MEPWGGVFEWSLEWNGVTLQGQDFTTDRPLATKWSGVRQLAKTQIKPDNIL